jgi:hypothetical protein
MTPRAARIALLSTALAAACAHPRPLSDPSAPVRWTIEIPFEGRALALHLSRPCAIDPEHPLVLFATGDGGWRGKDKDAFAHLVRWNYPAAGFSAPEYLKRISRRPRETRPADVARDYEHFIAVAKARLSLPSSTAVILVGVSRGSGLTIAAAGNRNLQAELAGAVTVALTREEEYVHHRLRLHRHPERAGDLVMLDNYAYLTRLGDLPLSIIQSTHDEYLPADRARELLGPDTALRQLHPIASKNHSFSDARSALYDQLRASLAWVSRVHVAQAAAR